MIDAFGNPQNILLVGGNSEIGLAILKELNKSNTLRNVDLTFRDNVSQKKITNKLESDFQQLNIYSHLLDLKNPKDVITAIDSIFSDKQFDVVILSAGILPKNNFDDLGLNEVLDVVNVNFSSQLLIGVKSIEHFRRFEKGTLVVISSVATERARVDNYFYGATKNALDFWAYGMADSLRNSRIRVLTVRPGMVRTKMSEGLPDAPFTIEVDPLAKAVVKRIHTGPNLIWVPGILKFVMSILRHLPRRLFVKISKARN